MNHDGGNPTPLRPIPVSLGGPIQETVFGGTATVLSGPILEELGSLVNLQSPVFYLPIAIALRKPRRAAQPLPSLFT